MTIFDDEFLEEPHDDEPDEEYVAVLEHIKKKENFEELEYFKNLYSHFINIIKSFLDNKYEDLEELNNEYIKNRNMLEKMANKLYLNPDTRGQAPDVNLINKLYMPFSTLLNAAVEFRANKLPLNWQTVRPELLETLDEIDQLIKHVSGRDKIMEEDIDASKKLLASKSKVLFSNPKVPRKLIKKITFIHQSDVIEKSKDITHFYINDNVTHLKRIPNSSGSKIRNLAMNSWAPNDPKFKLTVHDSKQLNRQKSALYMNGAFEKTEILVNKNNKVGISPCVTIELMSKAEYKQNLYKLR